MPRKLGLRKILHPVRFEPQTHRTNLKKYRDSFLQQQKLLQKYLKCLEN